MGIALPALTPAQESLFLTLGGRALDSRLPHPFLGDAMADEILGRTGYDLSRFPALASRLMDERTRVFDIAVRAKRLDEVVGGFVARHPGALVLDLGAGLDGRVFRVDPPDGVEWYDVDFPEIVALRRHLLPERAGAHHLAADLTDPHWLDAVPADRPTVIVADGLIGFLSQDDLVALLNRLTHHFSGGDLAFNAYTTYAVWALKHLRGFAAITGGVANPGFNDPHAPERWAPRLRLVEEIFLTRAPELAHMSLGGRLAARLVAPSPTLSRMVGTTILHYRF
ncbi:class I SAM-dependent methyltransferase [Sphaerisporangium corydalis]|uniref:Class I SAM-dependent methyltransferase n=1 Tax=Sphaerisporangium corydalis TaxID=1441875 RepID=A0ABV9ET85_9ACTN|nr:class I SAM-dependent methyltransferase [Sphaerisporangium corydalis]